MNRRNFSTWLFVAATGWGRSRCAAETPELAGNGRVNAVLPTLGGKQFWGDELLFHRWRIQRNVLTGHCRLLDEHNRRHAWGTFEQCHAKLDQIKREQRLPPMRGKAVIVMHGLFRSSSSMSKMARYLEAEGHYTVFNVAYPTTRAGLEDHAKSLAKVVKSLEGIEQIDFVAHSLGNLVIRHFLADQTDKTTGTYSDSRVHRIVMLGPPNNGARVAEVLGRNELFRLVVGESGNQIARDWRGLESRLAVPACEFAIVAGGVGKPRGYNPLLGEDNDLVVSVESTRLPGAADFVVVPVPHSFLMDNSQVQKYTLNFLQHGYFASPGKRQPIPRSQG